MSTDSRNGKWTGLIFGILAINASIFTFTYIQKYHFKYLDLIILFFTSFAVFYISTLFNNLFLRKHFWVGVTVSLLSSWITADFYRFKLDAERYKVDEQNIPTIPADSKITTNDSIIKFSNFRIQEKYRGIDTFRLRSGTMSYVAYPVVDNDWGSTDSIVYWACYKYQTIFFGKKHKDYLAQINSPKGVAFLIKDEVNKRKFSDALRRSVYNNNIKLNDHFKVIEIIDYEYEIAFWQRRIVYLFIIANLVWISMIFFKIPPEQEANP